MARLIPHWSEPFTQAIFWSAAPIVFCLAAKLLYRRGAKRLALPC
jgi:hypothetical protein